MAAEPLFHWHDIAHELIDFVALFLALGAVGFRWVVLSGVRAQRGVLPADDALFARIGSSGNEDWYLTDQLGSVRDIVNSS